MNDNEMQWFFLGRMSAEKPSRTMGGGGRGCFWFILLFVLLVLTAVLGKYSVPVVIGFIVVGFALLIVKAYFDEQYDQIESSPQKAEREQKEQSELSALAAPFELPETYIKIFILKSIRYSIQNCPALLWKGEGELVLLVLEAPPRKIVLSENDGFIRIFSRSEIRPDLQKCGPNNFGKDYTGPMSATFNPVAKRLPLIGESPHQYLFAGIHVSEGSVRNIMDLLDLSIEHDFILPGFTTYPFVLFAARALYQDRVISQTEYEACKRRYLSEMRMAQSKNVTRQDELYRLKRLGLITQAEVEAFIHALPTAQEITEKKIPAPSVQDKEIEKRRLVQLLRKRMAGLRQ